MSGALVCDQKLAGQHCVSPKLSVQQTVSNRPTNNFSAGGIGAGRGKYQDWYLTRQREGKIQTTTLTDSLGGVCLVLSAQGQETWLDEGQRSRREGTLLRLFRR